MSIHEDTIEALVSDMEDYIRSLELTLSHSEALMKYEAFAKANEQEIKDNPRIKELMDQMTKLGKDLNL